MVNFQSMERYSFQDLNRIMALLRQPGGCPWDREQTHESIRRNMLEEAYEAVEAIDEKDPGHLKEELGDVLLQVVFHARMAEEEGLFTLDDVVDGICKKLVFRHPHVFGTVDARDSGQALNTWDAQKREEKGQRTAADTLDSVARSLPALMRAEKIQDKTVTVRAKGGASGRLHGKVTSKEVAAALSELTGAPIDKKKIELETKDIKDAGVFNAKVRLYVGVVPSFKISVEVEQA